MDVLRGGSGGGGATLIGSVSLFGLRVTTFVKLTFVNGLLDAGATALRTTVVALALTFAVLLAAFGVEATRLVTFLVAAIFGRGFLAATFGATFALALDALATAFFGTWTLGADFAGFRATAFGFAVVRDFTFEVERDFGFDAVFGFDFINLVCALVPDNLADNLSDALLFANVFVVALDRLESASLIRFPLSGKSGCELSGRTVYVAK